MDNVKIDKTSSVAVDSITCEERDVATAQFKFVAVDDIRNSIPLLAVMRPTIPRYIKDLLKSDLKK